MVRRDDTAIRQAGLQLKSVTLTTADWADYYLQQRLLRSKPLSQARTGPCRLAIECRVKSLLP